MGLSRIKPLYILVIRYIQSGLNEIPKTPNKKNVKHELFEHNTG